MNQMPAYFSSFWNLFRNIIDIFIVAYLIYWVYSFFVKTRAMQLLKGVFVILVVAFLSNFFRFDTLDWLIKNFSSSLVVAVIILFQPEIRRIITQFGQKNWIGTDSIGESFPLDEVVNAITSMASEKVGSLIVIERKTALKGYAESGVQVDAAASEEFIRTIFFPLTPLHDGAIIMQNGRISAAACYLPLSDSKQLKKHHGARHRAALGIAEETDALVIVTSEETGGISLVVNGKMFSKIKGSDLKNMILYFINPKTAGEDEYHIK
jgi:diadenylate cyclase